ncbi:MAG: hypothetical protein H0U27_06705 [Nitrosopumilus sp.]|nr:hypothetical protein [Nitrosopumilus sp.]
MYIQPNTKIYSSFNEAKTDIDRYGQPSIFGRSEVLSLEDLTQGHRNLIVGEPGIGKTKLLENIKVFFDQKDNHTILISLKSKNVLDEINTFISTKTHKQKVLLLDALDEIRSSDFSEVLNKIENITRSYPDIIIQISSRWVFVNKYYNSFPEYRLITILPFSNEQVKEYLIKSGHKNEDVDGLLSRFMKFGHGRLVLQVPRYLYYLEKYIKEKSINNVTNISRNELFEYFIYSKLELEEDDPYIDNKAVIKRVLEKLALVMEIFQTNNISKDDLMTFFDDINSDLKLIIVTQISLSAFIGKTILQQSTNDLDMIEFENTEFQEYLAAKEITRFAEPHRVTFSFAADENLNEFLPSWFNTLTFLVDMIPSILEQLLEFSGIRSGEYKIADEAFFNFLGRLNTANISPELKKKIYIDILNYFEKTQHWLVGDLAAVMPEFFSPELELELKNRVVKAELQTGSKRYITLGNVSYLIAYMYRSKVSLDNIYWREKLIGFTKDTNINGVLQRHALYALAELKDPSVIDELPNLMDVDDEMVSRAFISTCVSLNPDNPKSLSYAIQSVRRNDLSGRYGLFDIKERSSVITFLKMFCNDEVFRKEFLEDSTLLSQKDKTLILNINNVFNQEIEKLCYVAIAKSVQSFSHRSIEKSVFVSGLVALLRERNPSFIKDIIQQINKGEKGNHTLFFSQELFVSILNIDDVEAYITSMKALNEIRTALNTMIRIKYSGRPLKEKIYEAGRKFLPKEYAEWEASQNQSLKDNNIEINKKVLSEFRAYLKPSANKFATNVFQFYNQHTEQLDPILTEGDKVRLKELIIENVLKFNPAQNGLTITNISDGGNSTTYTSSVVSHMFGDALLIAKKLNIDLTPFRANIALHIPYAYDQELKVTFELIDDFTPEELAPVIAIYRDKHSHLWRHQPDSFIELVQRYHLTDAVSVLRGFVTENLIRPYVRKNALEVADSLVPNSEWLQSIFNKYINSENEDEKDIAYKANGLLITTYGLKDAIEWRIEEIKKRATAFNIPNSSRVHWVGPIEDELRHDKPFAKPLTELKHKGFEDIFLNLFDSAMTIWSKGKDYHAYAQYVWEITYSYFDNLKEHRDYKPLKLLEKKISLLGDIDGVNWLASNIVKIRRSYLMYLGKPKNISEAIRKFNEARKYSDKNILNSADLFRHLQNAVQTDLRQWIEGQGAYKVIVSEKKFKGNADYEKLIQKTLQSQLQYLLMKRDFKVEITREEQLLNEKRTDFIVRYGFVGPVIIEIKLSSNGDLKSKNIEGTDTYKSMCKYMVGYGATQGIFLIIDNNGSKNINKAISVFGKIPNVWATSLDSYSFSINKIKKAKKNKSKKIK